MARKPQPRRALVVNAGDRRGTFRAAAFAVALLVMGTAALVVGLGGNDGPPQPAAASQVETSATPASSSQPTATVEKTSVSTSTKSEATPASGKTTPSKTNSSKASKPDLGPFLPASRPTALDIPSIGVRSTNFVDLRVGSNGSLDVPGNANEVGFYNDGPSPGQVGPAVLAAHVDSTKGPGIFYRLGAVKPGAKVHVTRQDGSVATFAVDMVATYPKDHFPSETVYNGDYKKSEIRLVTCGGTFDRVKHYLDNVVVFGHLTSAT